MTDYVTDFVQESEEHITELNNLLLELERRPDDGETLRRVFRLAHTLKGNCGAMGLSNAKAVAHALEDLLDAIRSEETVVSQDLMDTVFDAVDALEVMIEEIRVEGQIQTDPSPVIESVRDYLGVPDEAPDISPPSDREIDSMLAGHEPPTADEHEAYFVRLSIDDTQDVNNGIMVVKALEDAFELIGTEPSREAIETEQYRGSFDALFGSAVGEDAIAAALEPVHAVADFEIVTVTERFDEGVNVVEPELEELGADISPEEAGDLSVDELLDEFDEFDDLDSLVEQVEDDDDLDAFDEMGDAGSFDELLTDIDVAVDDSVEAVEEPEPATEESDPVVVEESDEDEQVDDAASVFNELKEEVEMVGFDELQEELDELEFDEFDSEDEVGMDELLGDDVDLSDSTFLEAGEDVGEDFLEVGGEEDATEDGSEELPAVDEGVADVETVEEDADVEAEWEPEVDAVAEPEVDVEAEPEAETEVDSGIESEAETEVETEVEPEAEAEAEPETAEETDVDDDTEPEDGGDDVGFESVGEKEIEGEVQASEDVVETGVSATESEPFEETADTMESDGQVDPNVGFDDTNRVEAEFDVDVEDVDFDVASDSIDGKVDDLSAYDPEIDGATEYDFDADDVTEPDLEIDVDGEVSYDLETDDATGSDFEDVEVDSIEDHVDDEFTDQFSSDEEGTDAFSTTEGVEFDASVETDDDFGADEDGDGDESDSRRYVDVPPMEIPEIHLPEYLEREDARDGPDTVPSIRLDVEQVDSLLNMVEGLVTSRVRLRHAIDEGADLTTIDRELDDLEDITSELQDTVMEVRLVPLRTVANRLPRVVRDAARDLNKEVSFEVSGDDVEVDRSILDRISDPLTHVVRNAVDHGIESPAERETIGKPLEGTIELRASRSRDRVTITVEDDGRGLDPEALRRVAIEEGVLDEDEAASVADEDTYDLIFYPGFSTAEEVTDVSGRGVGMDVVKRTIDDLDGSVSIESEVGEGTTVTMTVPVTVAIADVLFVESGGEEFGIPTKAVQDIDSAEGIQTVDGQSVYERGETVLPVIDIADALETKASSSNGDGMVVRIRDEFRSVAVHCDTVRDQQEVVVKPFEGFMSDIPGLSGATVRGRGEVVTILDVTTL